MARGNVPAAICSASASNLFGIFITPVVAGLLLGAHGGMNFSMDSVLNIVMQLLLPFIAGQIARKWIGGWVDRNKGMLKFVDQGSILLVVYTAFSEAVIQGLWHNTPLPALGALLIVNAILLAVVLLLTTYGSRVLGFNKEDEIVIVFCGSKKSLASGVPIATCCLPATRGRDCAAADAVPPDSANDLRRAGPALRPPPPPRSPGRC